MTAQIAAVHCGGLDGIRSNALTSIVHRDLSGKLHEPCLGDGIGRIGSPRADHGACNGRCADEAAAPTFEHVRNRVLGAKKGTGQIHVHHEVPVGERGLVNPPATGRPGVGNHAPEGAEVRHAERNGGFDACLIGHVALDRNGFAPCGADLIGNRFGEMRAHVEHRNLRALVGAAHRRAPTDTASPARDRNHPARESRSVDHQSLSWHTSAGRTARSSKGMITPAQSRMRCVPEVRAFTHSASAAWTSPRAAGPRRSAPMASRSATPDERSCRRPVPAPKGDSDT